MYLNSSTLKDSKGRNFTTHYPQNKFLGFTNTCCALDLNRQLQEPLHLDDPIHIPQPSARLRSQRSACGSGVVTRLQQRLGTPLAPATLIMTFAPTPSIADTWSVRFLFQPLCFKLGQTDLARQDASYSRYQGCHQARSTTAQPVRARTGHGNYGHMAYRACT